MYKLALFLLSFLYLQMSSSCLAQQDFFLESAQIGFSIPDSFTVQSNTSRKFEANNDKIQIVLIPLHYKHIDWQVIDQATLWFANKLDIEEIEGGKPLTIEHFNSYAISGKMNDKHVFLATLVHQETKAPISFLVNSVIEPEEFAMDILATFRVEE